MGLLKTIKRALFGYDWGPDYLGLKVRPQDGEGVRILVLDTGEPDHKAVRSRVLTDLSRSFCWNEREVRDLNGHATMLCGIVLDYAPSAELVCWKVVGKSGHADGATELRCALEAAREVSPNYILTSLALYEGVAKLEKPIKELSSNGIGIIAGAGNDPKRISYPAKFADCFPVFACDRKGRLAKFSPYDGNLGDCYPGVDIRCPTVNNRWCVASGTSLAAAACAGYFALARSRARLLASEEGCLPSSGGGVA